MRYNLRNKTNSNTNTNSNTTTNSSNTTNLNTTTNMNTTDSGIYRTRGQLISMNVEGPKQNEVKAYSPFSPDTPVSPSMPALLPLSFATSVQAHNDEQTMLWMNTANLFKKSEDTDMNIRTFRDEYNLAMNEMREELRLCNTQLRECRAQLAETVESNYKSKRKFRSMRKFVNKKVNKCIKVSKNNQASNACDNTESEVDEDNYEYRDKMDEMVAMVKAQDEKIYELTKMNTEMKTYMNKLREELADLNELYDEDYYRFCKREDDLKDQIFGYHTQSMDAKINTDYRIETVVQSVNECKLTLSKLKDTVSAINVEPNMKNDIDSKFADVQAQIKHAMSYADTKVAGDLREEFVNAIVREIKFESDAQTESVREVHNELMDMVQSLRIEMTDLITRSNEIHTARYISTVEETRQLKEDTEVTGDKLKDGMKIIKLDIDELKEICDYTKEDIANLDDAVYKIESKTKRMKKRIYEDIDNLNQYMKNYIMDLRRLDTVLDCDNKGAEVENVGAQVEVEANAVDCIADAYADAVEADEAVDAETSNNVVTTQTADEDGIIIYMDDE